MAGFGEEGAPAGVQGDQRYGLDRLLALSDGVFAFALTLLVVQLVIPDLHGSQRADLGRQLAKQFPTYVSYVLSFLIISSYWYQHHRIFRYVRRWDAWLIALNLGVLLFVAVLPFPTAVLGRYGDQPVAPGLYAGVLGATGLLMSALVRHATAGRRLVRQDLPQQLVQWMMVRALVPPIGFLLSIPLALWRPNLGEDSWALIGVALLVSRRLGKQTPSLDEADGRPARH